MTNKCIITGATGYIGSHLLRHLLTKGWEVHIIADPKFGYENIKDVLLQIDVYEYTGDVKALCSYFNSVKPDVIFHLASAVITNHKPEQVPILIQSNIQFGTEVLEAMRQSGTHHLVTTGSYWQNFSGEAYYSPVDLYAATKEAFEDIIRFYVEAHQFHAVSLRLYDVYGEDDRRPKLWNKLRDIAGTEESIDVSPGKQLLDMIHVSDVCSAYGAAYEYLLSCSEPRLDVFGVCTGKQRTLKDIVSLFESVLGKPIHVNWGARPYKQREVMKPATHYASLPNWEAKIDLIEGFKRFM